MIIAARSLARKLTVSPISSIVHMRPSGTSRFVTISRYAGVMFSSISGVTTPPGQIVFTVMRRSASSQARCCVRPSTPYFDTV